MDTLKELKKILGENRIRVNELMSIHTTFKIGGPAQFYLEVSNLDDLVKAIKTAYKLKIPVFILGGGSNIIVSDSGIRGLVIKNNCRKFHLISMAGKVKNQKVGLEGALVYAESGTIMNQLVRFAIEQGLSGLEYQLGLPGTVGGAIFMNSNFPKENAFVGTSLYKAKILTRKGEVHEVDKSYFKFAYDQSILQETGEIVLSVTFKLKPIDKKILWERGMETLEWRNKTQPKGLSAGCIFRNIETTSAGYLIDKAGLKGKGQGEAIISGLHANFILNKGGAKTEDILGLINLAKEEVYKKFGVKLQLEVKPVGFDPSTSSG